MLHLGLIGCGFIAKKHVKTIAKMKGMSLKAVSDISVKQMKNTVNDYYQKIASKPHIALYKNYQALLADPTIDVVVISTISGLHAEMTKAALNNGKHVIVEKPLALSLRDANDIISLAEKKQRKVLVCHQLRYRPLLQKVKEWVETGYLGKMHFGSVSLMLNRPPVYYNEARWKGTWEDDGGMLINQGIHLIDLLVWMMGDLDSVYGEIDTIFDNKETEDIGLGIINFKNGAKGLIEANTITKPKNIGYYLSLFGENGSIRIGGKGFNQMEHCYIEDMPEIEEELIPLADDFNEHVLMYENFYQSIVGKEDILMSAQEGKRALEGIFALYQSSQIKQPISFPIDENFSTVNMLSDA